MSIRENPRYLSVGDSNIPILRRIHHINRIRKPHPPLPEISKYIETIITSSGGYQEISGVSFKRVPTKKITKDRKKHDSKSEKKPKVKLIEANRTCEKRTKLSAEDLGLNTKRRKTEKTEKSEVNDEIKILKRLYPNPYELEKVDEFKILKSIKENKGRLQESQSKSHLIEEKPKKPPGSFAVSKLPALIKNMTEHRSNTTIRTISQSSVKEVSEEKNFKSKLLKSKIYVFGSAQLRQASAHINPENVKIPQIKKSERTKDKIKTQELVRRSGSDLLKANPRILSRIYEYKKLQHLEDLQQIYEIMNKVTESYLKITSKVIDIKYGGLMDDVSKTEMIALNRSITQKESSQPKVTENIKEVYKSKEKKRQKSKESNKVDTTIVRSQIVLLEPKIEETHFFDDADFMKTTQKIDEVLEFMYKFIQNFSSKEVTIRNNKKKQPGKVIVNQKVSKPPVSLPLKAKTPKVMIREIGKPEETCQVRSFTHIGPQADDPIPESPKNNPRARGRRRQITTGHPLQPPLPVPAQSIPRLESILSPPNSTNRYINIRCESSDLIIENEFQTVEGQNELGGCNEGEENIVSVSEVRLPKPVTPLSVKPKLSNVDSCKVIKNALETEEKLMANLVPSSEKNTEKDINKVVKNLIPNESFIDLFVPKTQARTFSFFNLKPRTSNFVLCVNSLPPILRTHLRRRFPCPSSCSTIVFDNSCFERPHRIPLVRESLREIVVEFEGEARVKEHAYTLKEEGLLEVHVAETRNLLTVVSFPAVSDISRMDDSFSLKNSESPVIIVIVPAKHTITVESFMEPILNMDTSSYKTIKTLSGNSSIFMTPPEISKNNFEKKNHSAEELHFVMKEAEESIYVVEPSRSDDRLETGSQKSLKNSEDGKETDTKKIYDLLLRTQTLQTKLRKYLNKMSSNPITLPSFLFNDTEKFPKQETKDSQNSTSSLINWCEQYSINCERVEKVHDSTSYHPPEPSLIEEKTLDEIRESENAQNKNALEETPEDDKDDRSSICSFKSSVEYSETNITAEETKCKNDFKNMTMFKKFLNDVDVFNNEMLKVSKENMLKKGEKENGKGRREVDVPSDPKALKTIFKGKESVTELSIGFKGVPLNKINNISVEKKKYSPNHTKVSICIFKESAGLVTGACRSEESTYTISNSIREKEISSYYLDNYKPSVSSSITECSRVEETSNRSYDLRKSDSDEEDDYKSVASTLSDTEISKKKKKKRDDYVRKVNKGARRKHRFEFYQKMDPRCEDGLFKSRYRAGPYKLSSCRELEPVQQALTELQMRMRSIKRDSLLSSSKYYKKALKLAKMSAGYCQTCGNRSVIPEDTFGLYKTVFPRGASHHRNCCFLKATSSPNTSYYSFCASRKDTRERFCDLSLKHSSSYLHRTKNSALGNSFHEVPVFWERI